MDFKTVVKSSIPIHQGSKTIKTDPPSRSAHFIDLAFCKEFHFPTASKEKSIPGVASLIGPRVLPSQRRGGKANSSNTRPTLAQGFVRSRAASLRTFWEGCDSRGQLLAFEIPLADCKVGPCHRKASRPAAGCAATDSSRQGSKSLINR
jgi:hypothetical protein